MHIIAGTHRHQKLITPKGLETRPTSNRLRQSVFNICQGLIEGARFLDLFAGSGAMGLEALSQGAQKATFVESDHGAIICIKKNLTHLNLADKAKVVMGDVFLYLEKFSKKQLQFDLIYADPPYDQMIKKTPFSIQLLTLIDQLSLLAPNGFLFIEEGKEIPFDPTKFPTLSLISSRKLGRSHLYQYQKKEVN